MYTVEINFYMINFYIQTATKFIQSLFIRSILYMHSNKVYTVPHIMQLKLFSPFAQIKFPVFYLIINTGLKNHIRHSAEFFWWLRALPYPVEWNGTSTLVQMGFSCYNLSSFNPIWGESNSPRFYNFCEQQFM